VHARDQPAATSAREARAGLETTEAPGCVGPLEPEFGALFHRVIGTIVQLVEPRRAGVPSENGLLPLDVWISLARLRAPRARARPR